MQLSPVSLQIIDLPAELIDHILSFVDPRDLVSIASTCDLLHQHSQNDALWHPHVNAQLPHPLRSPAPYKSFRDLFAAHHPYWLLTRHQLWFADTEHTGKLLLARYSPQRQCIEAYSLNAQRGQHTFQFWEHDREVIIHTFHPTVTLDLNQPVVRLDDAAYSAARAARALSAAPGTTATGDAQEQQPRLSKLQVEVPMATYAPTRPAASGAALYNHFMLARPIPDFLVRQNMQLWPPLKMPSPGNERTRNQSMQFYRGLSHKPEVLDEASSTSFRLRRWMEFSSRARESLRMVIGERGGIQLVQSPFGPVMEERFRLTLGESAYPSPGQGADGGMNMRVGEEVTTFATLDKHAYTPTKEKPWRGIWVGDYSGHGCEFLVVLQPEEEELAKRPLPVGASQLIEEMIERDRIIAGGKLPHEIQDEGDDDGDEDEEGESDESDGSPDSHQTLPGAWVEADEPDELDGIAGPSSGGSNGRHNTVLASDSAYHIGLATRHIEPDDDDDDDDGDDENPDPPVLEIVPVPQQAGSPAQPAQLEPETVVEQVGAYKGRIEAIKLTGDPNVPRGEYTFIAPDIGPRGLIRMADEDMFRGARIVRSVGHIAGRGYREDGYTPSQLILVSHDVLAQYWEAFGHISFYKRVDFDQFLRAD